jgi:hypothetical protein
LVANEHVFVKLSKMSIFKERRSIPSTVVFAHDIPWCFITFNGFRDWQYGSHKGEERSNLALHMASQFEVSLLPRWPLYSTPEAAAQST